MIGRQVQIWTLFIIIIFGTINGCTDSRKGTQERKPVVVKAEAQPVNSADQEDFKQKIVKLGVPMYKDAKFVEVKRKAKDSPLLVAVYEVSVQRGNDYDKIKSYYTSGLKKALVPKGWTATQAAENVILYRKGFEIFYVEFSRIIIPPDTKKVRIAFQYGK